MATDLSGVLYHKHQQVAYVTLNRPQCLNAMDLAMHQSLKTVWDDFQADDNVRVAVLSGAGDKAFSVGQDLKELNLRLDSGEPPTSFGSKGLAGYPRLTERFELTKPVIAKVCGYAYGGGFELALACDIILASDCARFALPEAKLGLIAGAGGVFRLLRQLPHKAAMGYLLTGRALSAEQALQFGLLNEVCTKQALDACVNAWVNDILRAAPASVSAIKQISQQADALTVEQAFTHYFSAEQARLASPDCIEGPRAFVEKRPPKWSSELSHCESLSPQFLTPDEKMNKE